MNQNNGRAKRGILFSLMSIILLVVVATSAIFSIIFVQYRTRDVLKLVDSRLLTAAELSREIIGPNYHDQIFDETSVSKEEFRRIVARNDDLCRRLNLQYLWSVLLLENRVVFTSATHSELDNPNSHCASFFETHRDTESFTAAMQSEFKPSFSSFKNEWGEGRQVLIPRKDAHGRTYIFGASVQLRELNAFVRKSVVTSLEICLAVICGAFLLALVLVRAFSLPLARLTEATRRIAAGDFSVPLEPVKTRELQSFSNSLDQMRQELKRRMDKLQESEDRFRRIVETANEGIWMMNRDFRTTFVNARMTEMLGYDSAEIVGRRIDDFMFAEDMPIHEQRMIERQRGQSAIYQHRFRRQDNSEVWAMVSATAVVEANGEFGGSFAMLTDISEQKRTEDALRESQKQLSNIIDFLPDATLAIDKDKRVIIWNRAIQQMTGISAKEMLGKGDYAYTIPFYGERRSPLMDLVFKDERNVAEKYSHVFREGDAIIAEAFCGALYGNRGAWVYAKVSPLRDQNGNVIGAIEIIRDITDLKRAEDERQKLQDQLLQSQKMESVGRLAGGVAHDFNNMLGVIIGRTELAKSKVDPVQPIYRDLEEILKAAERSANLTRQLLAFARKQTVAPKVLDLNETVASMFTMLERLLGEDIALNWSPAANLWPVKVDPSQIDQILANLCVNARDAIVDVGRIIIETGNVTFDDAFCSDRVGFVPGEYVMIAVSDNGRGMDKETLSHVFEPFFTTKGIGEGTGLGLATVYGAITQNGGFVNAYSEPGQGTTFKIYLPRYVGEASHGRNEDLVEPTVCGQETILLVEDESAILKLTATILEKLGYNVLTASMPGEAIRLASEYTSEIHLLLTDVIMPEMNGRDLAKNLLSIHPQIKSLFMSGYTANVIAHHGVLDEGVYFIQKPFSTGSLAAKVREVLSS